MKIANKMKMERIGHWRLTKSLNIAILAVLFTLCVTAQLSAQSFSVVTTINVDIQPFDLLV